MSFRPNRPPGALSLDPAGGLPFPRPPVPPTSKSWLRHCRLVVDLRLFFYRAMLCMRGSSRGPVSVCPSQVGVLLKWLDGSSWFVAWRLLSTSPTLCFKEIQVGLSAKITALLSGTFPKLRTWKISPRHIDRTCYQLSSRKVTTLRTR